MITAVRTRLQHPWVARTALIVGIFFCLTPWSSAPTALALGVLLALICGNPEATRTGAYTHKILGYSILGLGAGMNLMIVGQAGLTGLGITIISIALTVAAGLALGKLVKSDAQTSLLISVGTAICGGSAIAAIAPVIKARPDAISASLGTVFVLNAVALFVFPHIGHALDLTQTQFGWWSALAIHDTSSVIGAGLQFGRSALHTATTVKLARALWIVPLTIAISHYHPLMDGKAQNKIRIPWFIIGFLVTAALVTWVPALQAAGHRIEALAHHGLVVALFLIGTQFTPATIRAVGARPFIQGLILWLIVMSTTLAVIYSGIVTLVAE
jgi:uncharacterized integral membrane protein (TIGR00698 family)